MSAPERSMVDRASQRVGATLNGKYRLESVLGVGGMAAVYLAVHRNKNRVAIKMLHPEISVDADLRARFVREGYVANSIPHRGVVRVLDDEMTEDGTAFLVMELLDGETLLNRAERCGGSLPVEEVVALAHELLDVLGAAHAQGIIHRDIKPENLFLTVDGLLKVLDFGIARMRDPSSANPTFTGRIVGTPAFMPPEQALGRGWEVDVRSDLWACGATMFTLIAGRHVHKSSTPQEELIASATQPAGSLETAAPQVANAIVAVVDKALAFVKEDRFANAREMQEALAGASVAAFGTIPPLPQGKPPPLDEAMAIAATVGSGEEAARPETTNMATAPTALVPVPDGPGGPPPASGLSPAKTIDRPFHHRKGLWIAGAVAVAGIGGILLGSRVMRTWAPPSTTSSALEAPPRRCATNKDCETSPPSVCSRLGACVPRRGCATNTECIQQSGGKAAICRKDDGACVPLLTQECTTLLMENGNLENDSTIWVGAMITQGGPYGARYGKFTIDTLDLARRDFASITNGVPGARPGDPPRPLAVLLCDDGGDAGPPARHLVENVGVPAIIGFNRSKDVMDLATTLFNPRGVLALAALNRTPMLSSIARAPDGSRLVWRTASSATASAGAVAAFVSDVLVPRLTLSAEEPLKVVIVRRDNPNQLGLADKVVSLLRVGNRTVAQGGATVRQFVLDDQTPKPDFTQVRSEILDSVPHVIVNLIGEVAFEEELFPWIERKWPAAARYRPFYVGGGSPALSGRSPARFAASRKDVRTRMFSTDTPARTPANVKLAIHYNEVFSAKLTPENTFGPPYDTFYLLAYAVAALGDKPVTGVNLARAIPRLLPPGEPIDVGPASIFEALKILRDGKNIDLNGTTTSLDYDVETGDASVDMVILCLKSSGAKNALAVGESGLVFEARTGKLVGKMECR